MKQKDPNSVRGKRIDCVDFEQCPLCYGCRAFNSKYVKCQMCKLENEKKNLCKTHRHQADLLEKMISKERIVIE